MSSRIVLIAIKPYNLFIKLFVPFSELGAKYRNPVESLLHYNRYFTKNYHLYSIMLAENSKTPLEKWMEAQKGSSGFEDALRRLISFACSEWFRRETAQVISPEAALARVLAINLPEYPVGTWLDSPTRFAPEIAVFCEKTKVSPLPEALKGTFPEHLDLRGVVCPNNAMRSRLVMSGLPEGSELEIYLDDGSPIENVPGALVADGHIVKKRQKKENFWILSVVKRRSRV